MGCEHASLKSADFNRGDVQGVYSWSHDADEDLHCLQAAEAAYSVCRHHRMQIMQITGWWECGENSVVLVWKSLIECIDAYTRQMPSLVELVDRIPVLDDEGMQSVIQIVVHDEPPTHGNEGASALQSQIEWPTMSNKTSRAPWRAHPQACTLLSKVCRNPAVCSMRK